MINVPAAKGTRGTFLECIQKMSLWWLAENAKIKEKKNKI